MDRGRGVAGRTLADPVVERSGPAVFRLRGIPFLRGESSSFTAGVVEERRIVVAEADSEDGVAYVESVDVAKVEEISRSVRWCGAIPDDPRDALEAVATLPHPDAPAVPAPRRSPSGFVSGGLRAPPVPTGPRGSLALEAQRCNGSAASGAWVYVGPVGPGEGRGLHLDADGRAQVDGLLAGRYVVELLETGLVAVSVPVEVVADAVARVDLVEPDGGRVDVGLVDGDGRPLPFGTVAIRLPSRLSWLDVDDDGVQRIDDFADAAGRRVLEHVESGVVELSASWASRTATTTVCVADGRRSVARIVLGAPKEP